MGHRHGGKHWRRPGGDQNSPDKKWSHNHAHVETEVHNHNDEETAVLKSPQRRNVESDLDPAHLQVRQREVPVPSSPNVVSATVVELVGEDGSTVTQYTVPTLPATVSDERLGIVTIPEEFGAPIVVSPTAPITPPQTSATTPTESPFTSTSDGSLSTNSPTNSSTSTSTTNIPPVTSTPTGSTSTTSASPSTSPISIDTSIPSTSESSAPTSSAIISPSTASSAPHTPAPSSVVSSVTPSSSPASSSSNSVPVSTFPTVPLPSASVPPSRVPFVPGSTSTNLTPVQSTYLAVPSTSSHSIPISVSVITSTSTPITISSSIWSSSSIPTSTSTLSSSTTSTYATSSTTVSSDTSSTASSDNTYAGGGGRWGNPTDGADPASPTDAPELPEDGPSPDAVARPKIIGGVVGGVAGAALLLALVFFLLRLRRRKLAPHALGAGGDQSGDNVVRSMSETPLAAAAAAGATRIFDRFRTSGQTFVAPPPANERGFQKLGGRKLKSVLESGGDGYDDSFGVQENPFADPVPGSTTEHMGSSAVHPIVAAAATRHRPISRDIEQIGGPSQPYFPTPPLGRPESQESDHSARVVVRPSPARTPITSSTDLHASTGVSAATARTSAPAPAPTGPLPPVPLLRAVPTSDGIGRTHASADNSRTSRFTEGM